MKIENNLIIGDCLNILPQLPDGIFDLIIIDPPYNLGIIKGCETDKLSMEDFTAFLQKVVQLSVAKLKQTGSLYCFMGEIYYDYVKAELMKYLKFRREIIWHYPDMGNMNHVRNYVSEFDKICYFVKSDDFTFNEVRKSASYSTIKRYGKYVDENGFLPYDNLTPHDQKKWKSNENYERLGKFNIYRGKEVGNVFIIPRGGARRAKERTCGKHPTQKPEELINIFIKVSSKEGELVGDFFAGSGTTLVCAKRLRRKYFGVEISDEYYNLAKKRLYSVPSYKPLF